VIPRLSDLAAFLQSYVDAHQGCTKSQITEATQSHFGLVKDGSVYYCPSFAVRFSLAGGASFSNVVLSLSTLKGFDHLPFVVCVLRSTGIQLMLANTTFLKKISHSSHQLRVDNIRGSFLGHDIMRTYDNIQNEPSKFNVLFEIHSSYSWEENLLRLVEQTNAIVPTGTRFEPSSEEKRVILEAPQLAALITNNSEYIQLHDDLSRIVDDNRDAILAAGKIDNVNIRGNMIEQLVTKAGNFHDAEDISRTLSLGREVKVDIKTKILTLASSPKGYNVDKVLRTLAQGGVVFSFFFIGIDLEEGLLPTCLVSIFDKTILDATRVQFHWAGRNSRGVTQLTGDLTSLFSPSFTERVDIPAAEEFLQQLIDLLPHNERAD
jgi:hypothetical protein